MKDRKSFIPISLILIGLLVCSFGLSIPTVHASTVTIATYWGAGDIASTIKTAHPSASADKSAAAQTFEVATHGYLKSISLQMYKTGSPVGNISVRVTAITDTYGTNSTPSETFLETSYDYVSAASLGTSSGGTTVSFSFNGTLEMSVGEHYALYAVFTDVTTLNASNYVTVNGLSAHAYGGEPSGYTLGAWAVYATLDVVFAVYGTDVSAPTPAPTATPAPLPTGGLNVDTSDADAVVDALIGYGVPVVVMLLPTIFIWLIGGRGKWPMLIGIAIGTGIGYLFGLVPPWLVFLVSIGEVGMAYQSVRSGN